MSAAASHSVRQTFRCQGTRNPHSIWKEFASLTRSLNRQERMKTSCVKTKAFPPSWSTPPRRSVSRIPARLPSANRSPISAVAVGRCIRGGSLLHHVHDVVRGLWLALERGRVGERYLLAGDNLTHREFMSQVAGCAGRAAPNQKIPTLLLRTFAWTGELFAERVTRKEPLLTIGMVLSWKVPLFRWTQSRRGAGFQGWPELGGYCPLREVVREIIWT